MQTLFQLHYTAIDLLSFSFEQSNRDLYLCTKQLIIIGGKAYKPSIKQVLKMNEVKTAKCAPGRNSRIWLKRYQNADKCSLRNTLRKTILI